MAASRFDAYVVCPFFGYTNPKRKRIVCWDELAPSTTTAQAFDIYGDYTRHLHQHCCSIKGCTKCRIYTLFAANYTEDKSGQK